ncbi:hypothetical protein T439DRAFT_384189 [Meredithblackwellia eburnea MCA 4105]
MISAPTPTSKRYEDFFVERDFYGYGFNTPDPQWPGEAKIAINFLVTYHEGSELSMELGDPHAENLWVEPIALQPMRRRSDMVESEMEFGPRVGLPRLLQAFAEFNMPCTVSVATRALKRAPYWVKKLQEGGHEIACASSRWIDYRNIDPVVEEQHLSDAIDEFQALTGDKSGPQGWYLERGSNVSPRLYSQLSQERGLKMLYTSDSYGDDLPYWVSSPLAEDGAVDDGMLIIPHNLSTDDFRCKSSFPISRTVMN